MVGDELFCCCHSLIAEIVVSGSGNAYKTFRRADQAKEPLTERHRNDRVVLTVDSSAREKSRRATASCRAHQFCAGKY